MKQRIEGADFYIKSREDVPFTCHVCGKVTTTSIVDNETRIILPFCETCNVIPEKGWDEWETRASQALKIEQRYETAEYRHVFDDEIFALLKEGFPNLYAYRFSSNLYRCYRKRIVALEDNDFESLDPIIPTTDQLIDLNDLITTFWEKELVRRPKIYEQLFAAILYDARIIELLTEDLQEKILEIIDEREEAVEFTHQERARILGFPEKDKSNKTYWAHHGVINREIVELLMRCGFVRYAQKLDKIGKRYEYMP
jgi:hypothetical protein